MLGGPVTSGLVAKRASAEASGTTKTSDPRMACAQNRELARRAVNRRADVGLEPLTIVRHEADERYRRVAQTSRELSEVVEGLLRRGVEDAVPLQGIETG